MEAKKFIIRYGGYDFVFEGSILELTNIVRALEKLKPVVFSRTTETYKETVLQERPQIFSAKEEAEADGAIYVIDRYMRYLL